MFNFKKALILLLCAVMLIGAALPAFAVTGYEVKDVNKPAIGVRARCDTKLTLDKATAKLNLSYLPGYSANYWPEEDYVCFAELYVVYNQGGFSFDQESNSGMSATAEKSFATGKTASHDNIFQYFLNGDFLHNKSF